jgi:glutaredoxin
MSRMLARLFGLRSNRAEHLTFTLYTRKQCGCCHKALDLLERRQSRHGFKIELVDIDSDPELVAKYNLEVPVVAVNGRVRFRGMINPTLLDRLLTAESSSRSRGADGVETC